MDGAGSSVSTSPPVVQELPIHPPSNQQPAPPPPPPVLEDALPIFDVQKVNMTFTVGADYAAAQVANNVLILGLQSGRIMRIDMDVPQDVDDIDLPKKATEIGVIKRMFLDPTASHLIISTTLGENFYLHSQTQQPKQLSKMRGISIESVSWNPSQPTASTREILIGAADGAIYETYIESTTEFYRREEKYLKTVYRVEGPISGIWTDLVSGRPDMRRVIVATPRRILHLIGKLGRHGQEGSGSIFAKLFETETPVTHDVKTRPTTGSFAVTPEAGEAHLTDSSRPERIFAWSSAEGVLHGRLLSSPPSQELGTKIFSEARMLPASTTAAPANGKKSRSPAGQASLVVLSQWHIVLLVNNRLVAVNRLDDSIIHDQVVLDPEQPGQKPIALLADLKKNTYWLFTSTEIFEIVVTDEDRDIWKVLLKAEKFEAALQYANNSSQKDAVATGSGNFLFKKGQYLEAAAAYGKSSKPFEQVALAFIDEGQKDALRKYLLTKLASLKNSAIMQRIMLTSWITETFMAKLNALDDMVMTKAELSEEDTPADAKAQLEAVRNEFQDFVKKYKDDFDNKTVYDIISSHGREIELLYFSTAINDYNYVLSYWVQRENWGEALKALNKQSNPEMTYKYSTVLMTHSASDFVEILMRQSNLEPRRLIPAFLDYNQIAEVSLGQNQAVRYLLYEINMRGCNDSAVHNTLISIYASHEGRSETLLLAYLEAHTPTAISSSKIETLKQLPYDADFALRLCIQYSRIRSCVLILTIMGQYNSAVELALKNSQIDLAISIAERPENATEVQKQLWLAIARAVIADPQSATSLLTDSAKSSAKPGTPRQPKGLAPKTEAATAQASSNQASVKTALSLLRRAPEGILRIEDILPLLPDVILVDDFKDEICSALESYSRSIDELKTEMETSAASSARIQEETRAAGQRWVLLEPGESCAVCSEALLERRFWVWACGHGVHGDCAITEVEHRAGRAVQSRVRELRGLLEQVGIEGRRRDAAVRELDEIVGGDCPRCGELAVRGIDEPFVTAGEDVGDWSL